MKSPRFIVALGLAVTLALGQPAWADASATLPRGVAAGPSIEGISEYTLPNGLQVRQLRVPLGVVGMIYEARPNVTVDAAGLCLKSGNAALLRGSSSAASSIAASLGPRGRI